MLPHSRSGRALARYNMPKLSCIDHPIELTGPKNPRRASTAYRGGELIHLYNKNPAVSPTTANAGREYCDPRYTVDGYSKMVHSEILLDEK